LNFWISTSGAVRAKLPQPHEPPPLSRRSNRPLEESRRLLSTFRELVQIVAENSVRQQQQAEMLRTRILQMRAQMK
jgi:hypothetical protein